ncbi:MAG: TolC family protein [Chiayiivirga sp.]|jgi:cobalt-zinc-cadmium efflux system outer membrane protein|uniref:TolC family protein n=1 Tax=Chiayiivirga sp. TaxID=2041042 RepID=UPI0025C2189E|nr:TolC family protein [Chiayiivirga sp.]MCI1709700.1 TolC family protein [Chiayiivirga sp.]MCI1730014.1 TolC family protein [Chiayiivirga sp.]
MSLFRPASVAAALLLAGCASLPRDRGYAETSALLEQRVGVAPDATSWATPTRPEIPSEPLSAERALALAYVYNPQVRETYARLGLGRAELEDARRIANPTFEFARLNSDEDDHPRITRSLSVGFTDLLLLPARKRFAQAELTRLQNEVAAELLELSVEVESAWYEAVGARQVADMREMVAKAAETSAALAQRFFDAGNITRLQLEQERAAATQARIEATRAIADALKARSELAGRVGLPSEGAWTLERQLPAPPATALAAADLTPRALEQRLDLLAAQQALAQREDMLGVTRRWRWLGELEVGYEQEREGEDSVSQGPTLSLELPIFNQGQGAMAKAQAELIQARAELDAMTLRVHNDALLGVQTLNVAREVAEQYRTTLIPAREAIVARTQEEVNYMLVGVFELILAKREEYDAYQEYLEAVRDYWVARAELRGVVGGALPDDGTDLTRTIGVEAMLPSATARAMDHSMHGGAADDTPAAGDPHADHAMPKTAEPDPHAGHAMPEVPAPDPHAGHAPAPRDAEPAKATPPDDSDDGEPAHHDHGDDQ